MSVIITRSIGGRSVKNKFKLFDLTNSRSLVASAREGVKPELFYDLAAVIKMPEKHLAQIIHVSTRTVSNYRDTKKSLDPVQSEHLLKMAALYEQGEVLFGNVDEFNYWLQKPFWNTTEKPMDWLVTPGGVDLVMDELTRLAYGDAV